MQRLHLRFIGRVQGVGFRAVTRSLAAGHGLAGWVRNQPDGSVEAEAQGAPHAIEGFLAELHAAMARNIHQGVRTEITVIEGDRGFEIRR